MIISGSFNDSIDTGMGSMELGAVLTGAGARLQAALVTLGKIVGDGTLTSVKVDGAPGPATAAAASKAFTKYVAGAPAAYKKLTAAKVKATAATLAASLEAEIKRRGGQPVAPALIASTQAPKAKVKAKAPVKKKVAPAKKAVATKKVAIHKGNAAAARKQALAYRLKAKKASPAEAAKLLKTAKELETEAVAEDREAVTTAREADIPAPALAPSAAMPESAAPPPPPPPPPPPTSAMEPEAAMPARGAATPEAAAEAAPGVPTAPGAEAAPVDEGFFARYKLPILGAGAAVLVGAVVLLKKKSAKAPR